MVARSRRPRAEPRAAPAPRPVRTTPAVRSAGAPTALTALTTLTLGDLNRATLARQMLLARERVPALRALERLAGLQAQWPRPPHVGLWSRLEGYERDDLLDLLRRREAVRATMMRGTLHVVSSKDYAALRLSLQPMLTRGVFAVLRDRMDGVDLGAIAAEARAYLERGPATFEQVRDALAERHPEADRRAMGFVARLAVPLVQVPDDASAWGFAASPAFALADTWVDAKLAPASGDEGLVLRYLAAFGPGTATDVQTWSGVQGLKDVVEALRPKLAVLRDERKRELFDLPDAPRPGASTTAPPRFLPEFDNLLLAHTDRRRFVADEHRKRVYLPGLRIAPTFLVDGFVAGTWGAKRTKGEAVLTIEPFAAPSKATKSELEAEATKLVRFLEPEANTVAVRFAKPG